MNINSISIKNAKSFAEEIRIQFQKGVNIFIGPNAGGKSNLMDIINIVLNYFFLKSWRIDENKIEGLLKGRNLQSSTIFYPIAEYLDKYERQENVCQEIKISFEVEKEDEENLKIIIGNKKKLCEFEEREFSSKNLENNFFSTTVNFTVKNIVGQKIEFLVKDYKLIHQPSSDENINNTSQIFLKYLNNFEYIQLLIHEYNRNQLEENKIPRLYPPLVYFSPYRIPQASHLIVRLAGSDVFNLLENYKRNTSRSVSTAFDLANYYFSRKLRLLNNNIELFRQDEEVKFVNKYIKKLGYEELEYKEHDPINNFYQTIIKTKGGKFFELSKASSGEKEILNILLGISALNVRNGVIIIDEPELHLHPLWQKILLDLFFELSQEKGIQFFLVTHSPNFITPKSITNVYRVYAVDGKSSVIPPPTLDQSEKDLFQIVNVFNNEKIFFTDIVILVEGDIDNILYKAILEKLRESISSTMVIEIIEVKGKNNFEKFKKFLDKWKIKSYIIADKDYKCPPSSDIFILKEGSIETYFSQIKKNHFEIDDAIKTSIMIKENQIEIPKEIKDIFRTILKS
jgi:predicted ATP-dependent endonuclease of OLD family